MVAQVGARRDDPSWSPRAVRVAANPRGGPGQADSPVNGDLPAPFAQRKGRARAQRVCGVCPGQGGRVAPLARPLQNLDGRAHTIRFSPDHGGNVRRTKGARSNRITRRPMDSSANVTIAKPTQGRTLVVAPGKRVPPLTATYLPLSPSERGAHERSECAGYARGRAEGLPPLAGEMCHADRPFRRSPLTLNGPLTNPHVPHPDL